MSFRMLPLCGQLHSYRLAHIRTFVPLSTKLACTRQLSRRCTLSVRALSLGRLAASSPESGMGSSLKSEDVAELFKGAMPKGIGAAKFLEDHPEYDGRGVVVAIFDDGVDPGAKGLQRTSDGKPKILDIIDCTGSGDIDTSKIVSATDEGIIEGYFGEKLKVNSSWDNPSGSWRIGYKRAYDFFPSSLKKRLTSERRRRFDEHQRTALTEAQNEYASLAKAKGSTSLAEEDKAQLEELEERVKLLNDLAKDYKDPGPLVHTVVWQNTEKEWLVALDTSDMFEEGSSDGSLADFEPLGEFHLNQDYRTLSKEDACNFGVHVYNDGDVLSIFVGAGSHGTHVSGITAAYHEDEPYLNGIAPGAQLIVCKIGDSRLGSMETNVGLTRALIQVLKHKADLINMSYGEATATPDVGRFVDLASEVVNEHDVIYISSAGNSGPALSSVGAPGGTSSAIISVGAYVDPELADAGHSLRLALDNGQQYNWSSRGPCSDGGLGVTISAPGGAIAPVPQWTQQSRQLMNGTSMASPCACGGFALILSGLKARGQKVTPTRVRRAVENTALSINPEVSESPLTYGQGLLQVDKAFDLLLKTEDYDSPDVRYEVKVKRSDSAVTGRGVYLREPADIVHPISHIVSVNPRLKKGADTKLECLAVESKLVLKSTADWLTCPNVLLLPFNGRTFEIKVDPSKLSGGAHYAEVEALDSEAEWRGPLFRVPVTVLKPTSESEQQHPQSGRSSSCKSALRFTPGKEIRQFLAVPDGATWAEIKIVAGEYDTPKVFMLRASQLLPHTRFSATEQRQTLNLLPSATWSSAFRVVGGASLELTIAQFWSSLGESSIDIDISYHGIQVAPSSILLDGNAKIKKVLLRAPLGPEKVELKAKLDVVQIPLRPTESTLTPLHPDRDLLPEQKTIHKLDLTYALKVEESGPHKPTLPSLNGYVYDSVLEAEMYQIFDANQKLIGVGDIYPEEVELKKGDYKIRLMLRHDNVSILEKHRHLPLIVERKLKDKDVIAVNIYPTNTAAVKEEKPLKDPFGLYTGERRAIFLGPVTTEDKLPKDAQPGRHLSGKLQLVSNIPSKKVSKEGPKLKATVDASEETPEGKTKAAEKKLADSLRDARVKFLEDNISDEASVGLFPTIEQEILKQDPEFLPILTWRLRFEEKQLTKQIQEAGNEAAKGSSSDLDSKGVTDAAQAVLAAIDQSKLALYFARKTPEVGPEADEARKKAEAKRDALIMTYKTQARTYNALLAQGGDAGLAEKAEAAMKDLGQWVDAKADAELAALKAKHEANKSKFAQAIRALWKFSHPDEKAVDKDALKLEIELLDKLHWSHWSRAESSRLKDEFPPVMPLL